MTVHKWQFVARFRYHAFGWQSDKPLQRIKEALSEIKRVVKKEPELAAAGAVLFFEKISPAIEQVDSSSGAIGAMVNRAIDTLCLNEKAVFQKFRIKAGDLFFKKFSGRVKTPLFSE
jgi:hypothetical protein